MAAMAILAGPAPGADRILFVGNSYTMVNDLPAVFKQVVASAGKAVPEVKVALAGGLTLEKHLGRPESLKLIDEGNWDVVVLQGQSQEAAFPEKSPPYESFLKSAAALCDRIRQKSPKSKIVFYETWARHANYWKDPKALKGIGDNPGEMQANLRASYQKAAAQRKDCLVAPVGDAWELNYKVASPLMLHAKDGSHPGFSGTYLAALVFYATLYQPANLNVAWRGKLSAADAAVLQKLAAQATKLKAEK